MHRRADGKNLSNEDSASSPRQLLPSLLSMSWLPNRSPIRYFERRHALSVAAPSYLLLISLARRYKFSDASLQLGSGGGQRLTGLRNRRLKELLAQTLVDPRGDLFRTDLARNSFGQSIEPVLDICQRRDATVELQVQLFSLVARRAGA